MEEATKSEYQVIRGIVGKSSENLKQLHWKCGVVNIKWEFRLMDNKSPQCHGHLGDNIQDIENVY